jgi:hypothetical protein
VLLSTLTHLLGGEKNRHLVSEIAGHVIIRRKIGETVNGAR